MKPKRLIIGVVVAILALVGLATVAGFPQSNLYNALAVASGIDSKK